MATTRILASTRADQIDGSLIAALWFIRNRRFVMALCTLRSALAEAEGEVRLRIGMLVEALESARVADLVAA